VCAAVLIKDAFADISKFTKEKREADPAAAPARASGGGAK